MITVYGILSQYKMEFSRKILENITFLPCLSYKFSCVKSFYISIIFECGICNISLIHCTLKMSPTPKSSFPLFLSAFHLSVGIRTLILIAILKILHHKISPPVITSTELG